MTTSSPIHNALIRKGISRCLGICMPLIALAGRAEGVTYTAIDLNPSGFASAATSISDGQQGGSSALTFGLYHATLWSGSAASRIDLNPSGVTSSAILGISGSLQVGYGSLQGTNIDHALLWSGSAESVTDLNPGGYLGSFGRAISENQQVGSGRLSSTSHALLWSGSAASAIDLNPIGFGSSMANGVSSGQQVGTATSTVTGIDHAILWSGSAASAIDLTPSGFTYSRGYGISAGQQVGEGWGPATGGDVHALLWAGSASSAIDLNPNGFGVSTALGVSAGQQVGSGTGPATGGNRHALVWSGSASSTVDLHSYLPSNFVSSEARSIDHGNIVGYATDATTFQSHAVLWQANLTCEDLLRGSVHLTPGNGMQATFTPNYGYTLSEAAQHCGFDHFNWLQQIVHVPDGWTVRLADANNNVVSGTLGEPFLDPLQNAGLYHYQIMHPLPENRSTIVNVGINDPGLVDDKPFYFGEDSGRVDMSGHLSLETPNDAFLRFSDLPSMDTEAFEPGEYLEFVTQLVGIRSDGSYTPFDGLETNFRWKSNARRDWGNLLDGGEFDFSLFGVINDSGLPPIISGGVYDVQFEAVPEPSGMALLALGFLGIASTRWRQSRKHSRTDHRRVHSLWRLTPAISSSTGRPAER